MSKTIVVRGRADLVAIFEKYFEVSGKQNTSRPKATADFVEFISRMPLDNETTLKLKKAAKQKIDIKGVDESAIPSNMKIIIDIDDNIWDRAMEVFRYVFELKANPQMPYFIKVAGTAYLNETNPKEHGIETMNLEVFKGLSTEEKLIEIYKLLIREVRQWNILLRHWRYKMYKS